MTQTYDNIVIGGGAAGCVVAARLSEDPDRKVLLLEAGGHNRRLSVKAPAAFSSQFGTKLDWEYWTEPEENLFGRSLHEPRGKLLGGCSSMNAMMYVRGNAYDYDSWVQQGADGWSAEEVLPFFRRSERNADLAGPYHGTDGPMSVCTVTPDPVTRRVVEACVEAGFERRDDINGERQEGVTFTQVNQHKGVRHDTATAFLQPARRRPNLTVRTGALVHRVLLRDGRADGVEVSFGKDREIFRAAGDIVLSAGAFGTPEILQRSGIGPADHLRSVGVPVEIDLPAVGRNLMEHPFQFVNWELKGADLGLADISHPKHLARWVATRKGKLASNVGEALAFFRTDRSLPAPDMEFVIAPLFFWEHGKRQHPRPAFSIGLSYIAPTSRGSVMIRSSDPTDKARVKLRMLSDPAEVTAIATGIERAREVAAQPALREMCGMEINPGPWVRTSEAVGEYIRGTVEHTYHPACTARIGSPQDGACDARLRVHGVEGLRIADASAMPTITRGNTHAPTIMIGERCADFVRAGSTDRPAASHGQLIGQVA
ncbi:GMC family oxidoreductase [Paraconexibacter algicola]|uniref:Glucose-methanol-choline oxidoreductase n=1 Tax=Paraconexibacter algicola TaxID=2133960 RepID=A0A2T4UM00_9ACTN|nr:GMC family oxidoreductase N-terminal domain-containing protein [Paraconexibacter algicola]PTL60272.1 glucose-methanol-choline oxidoreductase [Paraconexibacter algicola]